MSVLGDPAGYAYEQDNLIIVRITAFNEFGSSDSPSPPNTDGARLRVKPHKMTQVRLHADTRKDLFKV